MENDDVSGSIRVSGEGKELVIEVKGLLVSRQKVLEAIEAEEELPGDPPPQILAAVAEAVKHGDKEFIAELLRTAVRKTKGNIRRRVEGI